MLSGWAGRALVAGGCLLLAGLAAERGVVHHYLRSAENRLWELRPAEAARDYARAARLDPLGVAARLGHAEAVADVAGQAGLRSDARRATLEAAIDLYLGVLARDPRNPQAWARLGRAYDALAVARRAGRVIDISQLGRPEDLREPEDDLAVVALRRAVALEPNNYDYANSLAALLDRLQEPEALDWYRRAAQILPRLVVHPHLGKDADPAVVKAAVEGARSAVGTGNVVHDARILEELALFHAQRLDYEAALEANREAIEVLAAIDERHPSLAWLWTRQGVWQAGLKRREEARRSLDRALELDPGRAAAHFALGRLAASAADNAEAVEHFRNARDAAPREARFQMQLARALQEAGRTEDAAREYQRAARMAGAEIPAMTALVDLYRRQGTYDRAIAYARRLVEMRPDEPVFRRQLEELSTKLTF